MNLYISCLITILRSITLSNDNYNRLINKDTNELKLNADEYLEKYYYEEALTAPINWHLDKGMENYVAVLTNKIKKIIARDIREIVNYYEPSDEVLMNILMSPLSEYNTNED